MSITACAFLSHVMKSCTILLHPAQGLSHPSFTGSCRCYSPIGHGVLPLVIRSTAMASWCLFKKKSSFHQCSQSTKVHRDAGDPHILRGSSNVLLLHGKASVQLYLEEETTFMKAFFQWTVTIVLYLLHVYMCIVAIPEHMLVGMYGGTHMCPVSHMDESMWKP